MRLPPKSLLLVAFVVAFSGGVTGCGTAKQAVSGTVTLGDQPLDNGHILFEPTDGATPTLAGGPVTGGRYSIPAEHGLAPGKYKVRITSPDPSKKAKPEDAPGTGGRAVAADRVPKQYNTDSALVREVTAAGPNRFDFSLEPR